MGSKAIFINTSRGNVILLLPFLNSLGPQALFLIDTTVFIAQVLISKGFLGMKLSGGDRPENLLLAHLQTDNTCVISYIAKISVFQILQNEY